ncbi:hypothetical protein RclHR1_32390003 [Rhizophagus clarus]|uniref:Aspartic peptidase DDI1-type domain-containing protein n=1 Tax=Rhizophagus clarus TaxID=94130 RepID=A0A2Z6RK31_9GLOM|nr:hypothetical protein RclHR1_32390003 [Rhizophagus clarus]
MMIGIYKQLFDIASGSAPKNTLEQRLAGKIAKRIAKARERCEDAELNRAMRELSLDDHDDPMDTSNAIRGVPIELIQADSCANISFIQEEAVPELKLKANKSIKHSITGVSGLSETLGIVKNVSIELLPGCIIKEDLVVLKGYKYREIGLSQACLKRYNYDIHESRKHIALTYNNKDYFIPIIPDAN